MNPFEVVKVTLQANRSKLKETPSTWSVTRQIINESGVGLNGLNRVNNISILFLNFDFVTLQGLGATIWRNGIWNCVYFGFYHSVKK